MRGMPAFQKTIYSHFTEGKKKVVKKKKKNLRKVKTRVSKIEQINMASGLANAPVRAFLTSIQLGETILKRYFKINMWEIHEIIAEQ